MLTQLLLCKRLFNEASLFARRTDAVSCGLAISLFQDAVEIFVWALIKDRSITVKDTSSFIANMEAIEKSAIFLTDRSKIQELNKARVGFKHYGNLPAPDEARKFQTYAEDFLRAGMQDHFSRSFDSISLVDLVSFQDVRENLKKAEELIESGDLRSATLETAVAKYALFDHLEKHVPTVDRNLSSVDRELEKATNTQGMNGFAYVADYLRLLREISLVTLLRIPLVDYAFLNSHLPSVTKFPAGNVRVRNNYSISTDEADCRRLIGIVVELSIRLEGIV